MRIGLVVYGGLNGRSGGFLYDRMLVRSLRRAGHAVTVFPLPWRGYLGRLADNWRPRWENALRRARLDLVLQDELCHPSLLGTNRRLRREGGPPIAAVVHHLRADEDHPAWLRPLYRMVEGRYLRSLDAFVANSRATRRAVHRLAGSRLPGVVALPGADHIGRRPLWSSISGRPFREGPLQLLFLGNVIPRKRLHDLLRALESLPEGACQITVAGREEHTSYAAFVRRRVQSRGLSSRVRFTGFLTLASIRRELRRAHMLAVPSDIEGFGLAYLEAMAFGVVPIASQRGGAPELIRHGYNGFLVPPRRPEVLAALLRDLADDRRRLARMSRAAWQTAGSWPGWSETGQRVRRFLSEQIQPAGPRRRKG